MIVFPYIVMANKVGEIGASHFFHTGHSTIINPFGEIMAMASMREGNITTELRAECFEKYQHTYSMHKRDDLYRKYINNNRKT